MEKITTKPVRIEPSAHEFLSKEAARRGVSIGSVLSEALTSYTDERRSKRQLDQVLAIVSNQRKLFEERFDATLTRIEKRINVSASEISILSAQINELSKLVAFTMPEAADSQFAQLTGARRMSSLKTAIARDGFKRNESGAVKSVSFHTEN